MLKSSPTSVLSKPSKLIDKTLLLSINLTQPYVSLVYSSFVSGIISNPTLLFLISTIYSKKQMTVINTEVVKYNW